MYSKNIIAGMLIAATVCSASLNNNAAVFTENSVIADAADSTSEIAYVNLKYIINPSTKQAQLSGVNYMPLKEVSVPATFTWHGITYKVTSIKSSAFKNNKYITSVDLSLANNLTNIGAYAFQNVKTLKSIKFNSVINSIGTYTFSGCTALSNVNFNGNHKITNIFANAFSDCTSLNSISIPSSVTTIYNNAFSNSGLAELTIPNSVKNIYANAFSDCKKLKKITFEANSNGGAGLSLGADAFKNDTALRDVYFNRTGIEASLSSFASCYQKIGDFYYSFNSYGNGQTDYCRSIYRKLLSQWGLKYSTNYTEQQQREFFAKLGEYLGGTESKTGYMVRGELRPQAQCGMAATVISARKGTCGGFSRVYYDMCLQAGVPSSRVLFAGDCHCHAWNYVKIGNNWYNIDSSNKIGLCGSQEFKNKMGWYTDIPTNSNFAYHAPQNWYASVKNYIGSDDAGNYVSPVTKLFDEILNSSHSEWDISFTGTRVK